MRFLTVNPTTGDEGGRNRPFPGRLGAGDRPPTRVSHRFGTSKPQARDSQTVTDTSKMLEIGVGAENLHFW